jgi:hypothetical protein
LHQSGHSRQARSLYRNRSGCGRHGLRLHKPVQGDAQHKQEAQTRRPEDRSYSAHEGGTQRHGDVEARTVVESKIVETEGLMAAMQGGKDNGKKPLNP